MNSFLYSNRSTLSYFFYLIKIFVIVFYSFNINYDKKEIILDNELAIKYEKNINYSNHCSNLKPIALYYPEFNNINFNYFNSNSMNISDYKTNINRSNIFFEKQNRLEKFKAQTELARNHGIYGFAICFVYEFNSTYLDELNIFLNNKEIEFPFFLIWKNNNFNNLYNSLKNKNNDEKQIIQLIYEKLVNEIQVFMLNDIYIKFNNKPIFAIENSLMFNNENLLLLREFFKEKGIGDIFILFPYENSKIMNVTQNFNALYDLSKYEFFNNSKVKFKISYYLGIIYKNINPNSFNCNHIFFRTSLLQTNLSPNKDYLKNYNPEKFYILNKIIVDWTTKNFNQTNGIFLIDSWNDYKNGNYLEPDLLYGYASLNSFSKALFNLSFNENNYNYLYLNNNCMIAIQAHIFFEDVTFEIINKTNNIPFKYDLYVTTISDNLKVYIEQMIKQYSKANNYIIDVVENKGRDVLPFINQMKNHFKKYKYICHIHSKKTQIYHETGQFWRQYLYNNLLGSKDIISEIINDFEKNENLGFIFPDTYYYMFKDVKDFELINVKPHKENIKYIKYVFSQMFKEYNKYTIGQKLIFPAGDMFWARTEAIHQIFEIKFYNKFPKEAGQLNKTIMHAIERIWIYLVKLNGYCYKTIFKVY